jgi:hypothetical protein
LDLETFKSFRLASKKCRASTKNIFSEKVDWKCISKDQKLSEDFIREFQHKVDWKYISRWQTLSEKFIREFQHKVDWKYLPKYQKLSKKFIREFQRKICQGIYFQIPKTK